VVDGPAADREGPDAGLLAEPMRSRWSPSVFDDTHRLAPAQLTGLLTAAAWAPSAGNSQPWRLLVAERGDPLHDALVATLSRGNSGWVPRASAVLVVASQTARAPGEEKDPTPSSAYDAGQAAAHVTLQARATGLDAHQFAGFDRQAFARHAGVPDWFTVVAGIAVGRHGDPASAEPSIAEREQRPRRRRALSQTAYAGAWGQPWRPSRPGADRGPLDASPRAICR
jgi:nitroreductase